MPPHRPDETYPYDTFEVGLLVVAYAARAYRGEAEGKARYPAGIQEKIDQLLERPGVAEFVARLADFLDREAAAQYTGWLALHQGYGKLAQHAQLTAEARTAPPEIPIDLIVAAANQTDTPMPPPPHSFPRHRAKLPDLSAKEKAKLQAKQDKEAAAILAALDAEIEAGLKDLDL